MQGSHRPYVSPRVRDFGDLRSITENINPLVGAADLAFSSPNKTPNGGGGLDGGPGPGAGGAGVIQDPGLAFNPPVPNGGGPGSTVVDGGGTADVGDVGDANDSGGGGGSGGGGAGGGGSGSGGGGGGGGGGGSLPFTGLAAGVVAAAGSALAAGGAALRRFARRRP